MRSSRRLFSTKQPPEIVFFTDRDLGTVIIPRRLENAGHRVERHDAHFRHDTPDTEWMPLVASRGWTALSRNYGQRYVTAERDMAMRSGLALFYLIGKASHAELADNLILTLPKIIAFRDANEPPFLAKVYRPDSRSPAGTPGGVQMYLTFAEWKAAGGR